MSVALTIATYLRLAAADFEAARLLLAADNRNAAHMCEQAAEKIICAALTGEGMRPGRRKHDLDGLVGAIREGNPLRPLLVGLCELSQYATTYRYPMPDSPMMGRRRHHDPTEDELRSAMLAIDRALARALLYFRVSLRGSGPAGFVPPFDRRE